MLTHVRTPSGGGHRVERCCAHSMLCYAVPALLVTSGSYSVALIVWSLPGDRNSVTKFLTQGCHV